MPVLAIDQGTSSTAALVVDEDGDVLGRAAAPVRPAAGPRGAVGQEVGELLESVLDAGRRALAKAGVPVGAVGVGNQGETVLRFDRLSGRPLGPAISWQDRRATTVCRELEAHAERLKATTRLPVDPYFTAPKMAWLARQADDGGVVSTIDAWVTRQLCGAWVTDAATASRTLLLDRATCDSSHEACELFGVDPDAM